MRVKVFPLSLRARTEPPPAIARWEWIAIALVVGVALAARLPGLGSSLWYDEIVTVVTFARLPFGQLIATFDSLNNHMFYSVLVHLSLLLFGEHAWSIRLPALLFGLGSIVVCWLMARRALDRWPALLVALLLALSFHHVWFSQNARGYTMLLFFTAASLLAFEEGLARPRWRSWTWFAVLAAAAIYTHLSAAFLYAALGVVALGLWLAALRERRSFPFLQLAYGGTLAIALAVLLHLPVIAQAVHTVGSVSAKTAASGKALAEWQNPLRAVQEIGNSLSTTNPLVPLLVAAAAVVVIVGAIGFARRQPVILLVYLVHIPLTMLLLRLLHFRIWPRYFFTEIGFIYTLIVLGMVLIAGWVAGKARPAQANALTTWLVRGGAAAMVIVSVGLLARNYTAPKQDFIGARDWVAQHLQPGDKVGATGLAAFAYDRYYRPGWAEANSLDQLHALRASAPTTWILVAFPHQTLGARGDVMGEVQRDFDRVATFPGTLGDGAIWVFRSKAKR